MKLASLVIVVLAAGATGACGSAHSGGTDAGGHGGALGGSDGGGQARGGSGGANAGRGGAAGAGGSGGTMASSSDAAADAEDGGCPATPPLDRSTCPTLNCMSPPGALPQYGPLCSYGNERCSCTITGTSGGCVCPAGQTCQAPWPAIWVCSVDGG
jgi:hypothetical protein